MMFLLKILITFAYVIYLVLVVVAGMSQPNEVSGAPLLIAVGTMALAPVLLVGLARVLWTVAFGKKA